MKLIHYLFLFVFIFIFMNTAQGQKKPLVFGGKAGIGFNTELGDIGGFNGTVFTRFKLGNFIFLQPELQYKYLSQYYWDRHYRYDDYYIDYRYEWDSGYRDASILRLPVALKFYYFQELYIEAGPALSYNLDEEKFGLSFLGGLGADINDKFCISARFDSFDFEYDYIHDNSISLNFGIMF